MTQLVVIVKVQALRIVHLVQLLYIYSTQPNVFLLAPQVNMDFLLPHLQVVVLNVMTVKHNNAALVLILIIVLLANLDNINIKENVLAIVQLVLTQILH